MKTDLLLEQFKKMQLRSDLTFQIKGGDVASQCFVKTDSFNTSATVDYTNAPAHSSTDRTLLGNILDALW
ncbi:MAG: hypothetical protein ACK5R0_05425 [Bacteroidota bacterium]|jgi:hypothetical protein|nr:hypothetical protein [Cytophagales bacterium]